ncbi:FAD:protein FMN transferase [Microbacterium lacus]|uniref:FAD:protein FMN transferase n=1 Tax=Microbacterium lacus TaxID=415217 RepID=UPI00384B8167
MFAWNFEAIGTHWQINTDRPVSHGDRARVTALIDRFEHEWSRFRADSAVSALANGVAQVPLPPDAPALFDTYAQLSAATDGAVNPLVGDALARRGYGPEVSLIDRGAQAAPEDWRRMLAWSGEHLSLTEPAMVDIGAIGKGRLVDIVFEALCATTSGTVVVDASGDSRVRGQTQRVGLEHPFDTRRAIGVIEVSDAALCASATNRRAWGEGLHHVLDARTGEPVRAIAATWAIAETAMRADAIATALFFDGGPELAFEWDVQWVRMTTDGSVQWSPGSKAELFL